MASRTDTNDGIVAWKNTAAACAGRIKGYPSDLTALSAAVAVAAVAVAFLPRGSVVRVLAAAPLALFLPGYALVSLLHPGSAASVHGGGLGTLSRIALGFGTSLAVLPLSLVAVGAFAPLSVSTVLGTLVAFTITAGALAAVRRIRLPAHRRYRPNFEAGLDRLTGRLGRRRTLSGKIAVVLLATGVVLAASTAALAVAAPPSDDDFTGFYLATAGDDGTLQTGGYPTNLTQGDPASLVTVVANEEDAARDYQVVVQLQRVENGTVVERTELKRFSQSTPVGERWRHRHEIAPTMAGEDLRLTYLLYRGDAPDRPTSANAYRHLNLWVDVDSA